MSDYDIGVDYTPEDLSHGLRLLPGDLKRRRIKYVRIQWVDFVNNTRFRIVPLSYFEKLLESRRPGVGAATTLFGLVDLEVAEGIEMTGEYLCVPDLNSLRECPYAPGHASVMVWFQQKTPVPGADGKLSLEVDLCPRTLLDRIVKEARSKYNVEFLVGFEAEFILLKSTRPIEAVNHHAWSSADGFPAGKVGTIAVEEIADAVQASGLELQMYHAEAAPGQYEVITGPLAPLDAADALVHTRELIRNVASKHGLRATFAPKPFPASAGTGAHTHISLHSSGGEPKPREGLASYEKSFLAGVLDHIQAITALTLPIPASYQRVSDHAWAGGTYVSWGTESREASVRLVNASSPSSRRFEMRFVDGTASPYLVLAGILVAGLEGLKNQQQLTMKDSGSTVPSDLSPEEREALGITQRLPLSHQESRGFFENSQFFRKAFGENFVTKYLSVNKLLGEILERDPTEEDRLSHLVEFF